MPFLRRRPHDGARQVRALLWAVSLCLAVAAAALDLRIGTFRQPDTGAVMAVSSVTAAITLLTLPLFCVVAVRPRALAGAGAAAAAVSLGCSLAVHLRPGHANASSAYGAFEPVALLVVLAVTTRRAAPLPGAAAAVALIVAVVVRPLSVGVREGSVTAAFLLTLVTVTVTGASLATRLVVTARRQRERSILQEQRIEFARDLHDFVAHHVTGIIVQAQGAQAVADAHPELVRPALQRIEQTGAEALVSLRRMVGGLRTESVDGLSAAPASMDVLRSLVAGFQLRDVSVQLTEAGPTDTLPSDLVSVVHRVTLESLTNIRKHAAACRRVRVCVRVAEGHAVISISNDGVFGTGTPPGFGIKGLEERVAGVGGTLQAGVGSDGEWLVQASLPLRSAPVDAR
ncbi:sensor histidine kinase [Streptomyces galbus]|uniref:sensor histidine kinase n=1 Tax=Streptomyces galbus TaxID=33898 RepID=UPI00381B3A7D